MIDPQRLETLLEELYAIEPELRAQDASLRRLAIELIAAKPDASVDEQFIERLRGELRTRAAAATPSFNFMNILTAKNARFLVPSLAVLTLAVVGAVTWQNVNQPSRNARSLALAPTMTRMPSGAFGKLGVVAPGNPISENADVAAIGRDMATAPAFTSGVAQAVPAPAALPPMAGGGMGFAGDAKLVSPDWIPTIYSYAYKGDAIENLEAQVDVYRRVKGVPSIRPLAALQDVNLGLIDLGKAKDGFVQSFTIAENRDQGYVFNVDPQEGTVNVYQNGKWISPLMRCASQECYEQNRLKESDMLSDEDAIRAADAFLNEYGISKADYGTPVVMNQWRVQYMAADAAMRSSFWFPENVSVIYPTLVNGKIAYDEGGAPAGMSVSVDIRSKRAQGIWNLATRSYQVSSYAAETDAKRLIAVAENTDNYYGAEMPVNAKKIEMELGTPMLAYVHTWQQTGDTGAEVLVPALVFPIKNAPKDFWRQNVVVPLAKDLLDARVGGGTPMPVDRPLMMAPPAATVQAVK